MPLVQTSTDYTLASGQSVSGSDTVGLRVAGPSSGSVALAINGALSLKVSDGADLAVTGVRFDGDFGARGALVIGEGGALRVAGAANATAARGVDGNRTPDIVNHGLIDVRGGAAYGITTFDGTSRFENTGTIQVSGGPFGRGVWLANSSAFVNSGVIDVTASSPRAPDGGVYATTAVMLGRFKTDIVNSGVIRASTGSEKAATAMDVSDGGTGHTLFNSGRIEGDVALYMYAGQSIANVTQRIVNTGSLIGEVKLYGGAFQLENGGTISGAVQMGPSDDVYAGQGGTLVGVLHGGDGADSLAGGVSDVTLFGDAGADTIVGGSGRNYLRGDDGNDSISGGANFDDINGNMGADTASGGLGDDWVVGGKDNDSLSGDAGGDLVYGNLGADTCSGGDGNDIVRGGQDNDSVSGGAGDDYVSGDRGDDTVTGGAGADVFHTFGDAGVDRVTDFSLAQGDRVQLDPGTQYTVAQSGADTVISMTGGGQMILVGVQMSSLTTGWIFGA